MKTIITKDLFKKEPKVIVKTIGFCYAIFGSWALIMSNFLMYDMSRFSGQEEVNEFVDLIEMLKNIWSIYMPILMIIGLFLIGFSYYFDRLRPHHVRIQQVMLLTSAIWGLAYTIASIPYLKTFTSIQPADEIFEGLSLIFGIIGFIGVIALMIVPNYRVLKKLKLDSSDVDGEFA
ncbi:hypothetical protein [Roseivirga pacifica]|uniref:hypothetical protein n=1 Tax=Roseivirga pacifica TaxID=1267423 RepID=UPI003BAAE3B1